MLNHIGFYVDDLKESDQFYRHVLESIGYTVVFEIPQCIAYGTEGKPTFEIYTGKPKSSPIHIAICASSKKEVEAFYEKGLELGAQDNGKPGYREYCPGYYAAFLIDPNGHNIEAVYMEKASIK